MNKQIADAIDTAIKRLITPSLLFIITSILAINGPQNLYFTSITWILGIATTLLLLNSTMEFVTAIKTIAGLSRFLQLAIVVCYLLAYPAVLVATFYTAIETTPIQIIEDSHSQKIEPSHSNGSNLPLRLATTIRGIS